MGLTTSLFLFALSSTAGLAVGMFFARPLKEKRDFYEELLGFANAVAADMSFRQDGVRAVSSGFAKNCKSKLKAILEAYSQAPMSVPEIKFLDSAENTTVSDFFFATRKIRCYYSTSRNRAFEGRNLGKTELLQKQIFNPISIW